MANLQVPDSLLQKIDLYVNHGRHDSRTALVIEALDLWFENDELFNGIDKNAFDAITQGYRENSTDDNL